MRDGIDIEKVSAATVKLVNKGGLAVRIADELLVTAAHCISYDLEGGIVLGDHLIEEIETASGDRLKAAPLAIDPVTDIALLCALDGQEFYDEAEKFEDFCLETEPLRLFTGEIDRRGGYPIHIFTHDQKWIDGSAMGFGATKPKIYMETEEQIEGGTSGGPIVNDNGELVAIVSHAKIAAPGDRFDAGAPRPHLALPKWVYLNYLIDSDNR